MLKIKFSLIKKIYLQNELMTFLRNEFNFVLVVRFYDLSVNNISLLKQNTLDVNTKYKFFIWKNLFDVLKYSNTKFKNINNLFLNKEVLLIKFMSLKDLVFFLKKISLQKDISFSLLGGIISNTFWTSNDLKLLEGLGNSFNFNELKFSLYNKSLGSLLYLLKVLLLIEKKSG